MASDVGSFDSLWTSDIGPTPIPMGGQYMVPPRKNLETERTRGFSVQSYQPAPSNPYSQLDIQQKAAVLRQGTQPQNQGQKIPTSMVFISKQEMEQREQREQQEKEKEKEQVQQIEYEKQLLQLQMMQQMQQQNKGQSLSSEKITDLFRKQQREIKDLKQTLEKVKNPNSSNEMALLHEISRLRNLVNEYSQSPKVETVYPSSSRINYSNTIMADPNGGFWEQKKYDVLLGIIIALLCIVIIMLYMVIKGGKSVDGVQVKTVEQKSLIDSWPDSRLSEMPRTFERPMAYQKASPISYSTSDYKPEYKSEYSPSSFSDIEKRLDAIVKQMANK